jgi:hypothetical protein
MLITSATKVRDGILAEFAPKMCGKGSLCFGHLEIICTEDREGL